MICKITNLVKDGNKFTFNHVRIYEFSDNDYNPVNHIIVTKYSTDENGEGLFKIVENVKYLITYKFSCKGKTKGAARKYINRKFGIINYAGKRIYSERYLD